MAAKVKSKKVSSKSARPTIHSREQAAIEVFAFGFVAVAVLFLGVSLMLLR